MGLAKRAVEEEDTKRRKAARKAPPGTDERTRVTRDSRDTRPHTRKDPNDTNDDDSFLVRGGLGVVRARRMVDSSARASNGARLRETLRRDGYALGTAEAARRGHGLGLAELVRRRRREGGQALHVVLVPRRVRAREAADGGEPARATVTSLQPTRRRREGTALPSTRKRTCSASTSFFGGQRERCDRYNNNFSSQRARGR